MENFEFKYSGQCKLCLKESAKNDDLQSKTSQDNLNKWNHVKSSLNECFNPSQNKSPKTLDQKIHQL